VKEWICTYFPDITVALWSRDSTGKMPCAFQNTQHLPQGSLVTSLLAIIHELVTNSEGSINGAERNPILLEKVQDHGL
jgi:hypothetical protein